MGVVRITAAAEDEVLKSGDLSVVEALVARTKNPIALQRIFLQALERGGEELALTALHAGADLNINGDESLLEKACEKGYETLASEIIRQRHRLPQLYEKLRVTYVYLSFMSSCNFEEGVYIN